MTITTHVIMTSRVSCRASSVILLPASIWWSGIPSVTWAASTSVRWSGVPSITRPASTSPFIRWLASPPWWGSVLWGLALPFCWLSSLGLSVARALSVHHAFVLFLWMDISVIFFLQGTFCNLQKNQLVCGSGKVKRNVEWTRKSCIQTGSETFLNFEWFFIGQTSSTKHCISIENRMEWYPKVEETREKWAKNKTTVSSRFLCLFIRLWSYRAL